VRLHCSYNVVRRSGSRYFAVILYCSWDTLNLRTFTFGLNSTGLWAVAYCCTSHELATFLFIASVYYLTTFVGFLYICANPFIYATKFDPVKRILVGLIPCKRSQQPIQREARLYTVIYETTPTATIFNISANVMCLCETNVDNMCSFASLSRQLKHVNSYRMSLSCFQKKF